MATTTWQGIHLYYIKSLNGLSFVILPIVYVRYCTIGIILPSVEYNREPSVEYYLDMHGCERIIPCC